MNAKAATCPPKNLLRDFGLGILDDRAAETLSEHLDTCADCRAEVDGVVDDSFVERMRAAVRTGPAKPSPGPEQTIVLGAESVSNAASSSETPTAASGNRKAAVPSPTEPASISSNASGIANLPPALAENPDFEIVKALGQGGMGVVYLARNRMMDRLEAFKVVNKSLLDRPGALDRFQQEIRSAARLLHPNIVAANGVFRLGDLLVFSMEYVDGQDLSQVVKRRGPLPITNATFYAHQVALGLQHAHEKGMVHRDIKPGNLMLAIEGKKHVLKILDFGLAKATSEKAADAGLTKSGQMLGTPDYIAPEQTLDAQKADIRADIYSLGCTLYFLLSGHPPFQGNSLYEVLQAHHQTEARPLNLVRPDVPAELAAVVSKMMAKDPANRYQTPGEVAKALGPFFRAGAQAKVNLPAAATTPVVATPIPVAMQQFTATADYVDSMESLAGIEATPGRPRKKTKPGRRRLVPLIAVGLLAVGLISAAAMIFRVKTPDGIVVLKVNVPNADVLVDGNQVTVTWADGGMQAEIHVPPGSRKIELKKDGFKAFGETVSIAGGGHELLAATLEPLVPSAATIRSATPNAPAFQEWMQAVAALPAEKQVEAVAKKLQELNPGFDGKVKGAEGKSTPEIENGVVTAFGFAADNVTDISPVRALAGLKILVCNGGRNKRGKLSNLSPLQGMSLDRLTCDYTQVSDLSPLRGMKLTWLNCQFTQVSDLSPLRGMPLTFVTLASTGVSDLSPLQGMPVTTLFCSMTQVFDLSPLQGMPLTQLNCAVTSVSDLSPLEDCKSLKSLYVTDTKVTPAAIAALQKALPTCKIRWDGSANPTTPSPAAGPPSSAPPPAIAPFDAKQARAHQEAWAKHLGVPVEQTNSIGMKLVLIPPGEFTMGSTPEQTALSRKMAEDVKFPSTDIRWTRFKEEVPHHVTLSKPHWLGMMEVTVGQFKRFVDAAKYVTQAEQFGFGNSIATKPDDKTTAEMKKMTWRTPAYAVTDDSPVTQVTWNDAVQFCNWLSVQEKFNPCYSEDQKDAWVLADTGTGYRLPTEAEWEYACRAGTTTQFSFGDDPTMLDTYGWFNKNSGFIAPRTVALKVANSFGLFDMHGNVCEWCHDFHGADYYSRSQSADPFGPSSGSARASRGGSYYEIPFGCRSAYRNSFAPVLRNSSTGFRVIRVSTGNSSATKPMTTFNDPAFQEWVKTVAALPAEKQVDAVAKKLQRLNPEFDGRLLRSDGSDGPTIENGIVTDLRVSTDHITDISPVRALVGLEVLNLHGSSLRKGRLADLSPLQGVRLKTLICVNNPTFDLSPLRGMSLENLHLSETLVSDLSTLRGMPLTFLAINGTDVSDLMPLKDLRLQTLSCIKTKVSDLSPLTDMPLKKIDCDFVSERDSRVLRSITTLETINLKPAGTFWRDLGIQSSTNSTPVSDASPALPNFPPPAIAPFDAKQARMHQEAWAKHVGAPVERTNSIGMKLVLIPPGEFMMGATEAEITDAMKNIHESHHGRLRSELPRHKVTLTHAYWIGTTEATIGQFRKFVKAEKYVTDCERAGGAQHYDSALKKSVREPSTICFSPGYAISDESPVTLVTWNDAVQFCNWLSHEENLAPAYRKGSDGRWQVDQGPGYRLPTEAEWEFACRAGTETLNFWGDNINDASRYGWFAENSDRRAHAVGEKEPNAFGLFDIQGNVSELAQDWFAHYFAISPPIDPPGPAVGTYRVIRGGGGRWTLRTNYCRSSERSLTSVDQQQAVDHQQNDMGFRVARAAMPSPDAKDSRASSGVKATVSPGQVEDRITPAATTLIPSPAIAPFDAKQARAHQEGWAKHLGVPVEQTNSIGMKFVMIPPGEFMMGSTPEEMDAIAKSSAARFLTREIPKHRVTITNPYRIGITEVTLGSFKRFVDATGYVTDCEIQGGGQRNGVDELTKKATWLRDPSMNWRRNPDYPVTENSPVTLVSWRDAAAFCNWLSEREKLEKCYRESEPRNFVVVPSADGYRLPSEAEWEFACRAGTTTLYSFGTSAAALGDYAWEHGNAAGGSRSVGLKLPNAFGLSDMHGNIGELCDDEYLLGDDEKSERINPRGPLNGSSLVRGGSWYTGPEYCRCAARFTSGNTRPMSGFRVACSVETQSARAYPDPSKPGSTLQAPAFRQWMDNVAAMPAEKQVEAVAKKLQELNPGFDGKITPKVEGGVVTVFECVANNVTDISPVRALQQLKMLNCYGTNPENRSKLTDLSPLKGMSLKYLSCGTTKVSDLSPLQGMPLTTLSCSCTDVSNLSPLQGMRLTSLFCYSTKVSDLSPLKGMPLTTLNCSNINVSDLAPLQGMPLTTLICSNNHVSDLSPLQGMPLTVLTFNFTQVSNLSPLAGMTLTNLNCFHTKVSDLLPLTGMRTLSSLNLQGAKVTPANIAALQKVLPNCKIQWDGTATPKTLAATIGPPTNAPLPAIAPFDSKQARAHQEVWAKHLGVPAEQTNSIGMKLVLIPPGEFMMGRAVEPPAAGSLPTTSPHSLVRLTHPFVVGATEVTLTEFRRFVDESKYTVQAKASQPREQGLNWLQPGYQITDSMPVTFIDPADAMAFCNWLSAQGGLSACYRKTTGDWELRDDGDGYRLPAEFEWEWAHRAGTATSFSFGNDESTAEKFGWSRGNSDGHPHGAEQKLPNAFGLFDTNGNASEMCEKVRAADPVPGSPFIRVSRGGSWEQPSKSFGSAERSMIGRQDYFLVKAGVGFRVVRSIGTGRIGAAIGEDTSVRGNMPRER